MCVSDRYVRMSMTHGLNVCERNLVQKATSDVTAQTRIDPSNGNLSVCCIHYYIMYFFLKIGFLSSLFSIYPPMLPFNPRRERER